MVIYVDIIIDQQNGHHGVSLNQPGGNHLSLTVSGGVSHLVQSVLVDFEFHDDDDEDPDNDGLF